MATTKTGRAALIAAVRENDDAYSADQSPRLILADWLEEFGGESDRQEAEMIRRLVAFVKFIKEEKINPHWKFMKWDNLVPPTVSILEGPTYWRIVKNDAGGTSRSVHCFVRKADGAILFAAGWKGPAKYKTSRVRGWLRDGAAGWTRSVDWHGAAYMR